MSGEKGIMLCERPGPSHMDTSPGPKPFLPSSLPSGLEPLGLVPTHKTYPPSLAPKPENINLKTIAAVRELEHENRLAALREEEQRMAKAAKAEQVTAFGSHLRAAILAGEDVSFWRAAKKADAVRESLEASKARVAAVGQATSGGDAAASGTKAAAAAANKADMTSFVDGLLKEAADVLESPTAAVAVRADGTADASTSAAAPAMGTPRAGSAAGGRKEGGAKGGKKGAIGGRIKPAWAMTAEEVARLEDWEEEELLKFADDLDFDSFMAALDDVELQDTVKSTSAAEGGGEAGKGPAPGQEKAWKRNLVKVMNHAAMRRVAAARRAAGAGAGEDDDGMSVVAVSEGGASAVSRATAASRLKSEASAARRAGLAAEAGGKEGGWDASSRAADDVARLDRAKAATQEAQEFLRENPELRAVHSPASVRAMISKVESGTAS